MRQKIVFLLIMFYSLIYAVDDQFSCDMAMCPPETAECQIVKKKTNNNIASVLIQCYDKEQMLAEEFTTEESLENEQSLKMYSSMRNCPDMPKSNGVSKASTLISLLERFAKLAKNEQTSANNAATIKKSISHTNQSRSRESTTSTNLSITESRSIESKSVESAPITKPPPSNLKTDYPDYQVDYSDSDYVQPDFLDSIKSTPSIEMSKTESQSGDLTANSESESKGLATNTEPSMTKSGSNLKQDYPDVEYAQVDYSDADYAQPGFSDSIKSTPSISMLTTESQSGDSTANIESKSKELTASTEQSITKSGSLESTPSTKLSTIESQSENSTANSKPGSKEQMASSEPSAIESQSQEPSTSKSRSIESRPSSKPSTTESQSGESTTNSEYGFRKPTPSAKPPTSESRSKESTSTYEASATKSQSRKSTSSTKQSKTKSQSGESTPSTKQSKTQSQSGESTPSTKPSKTKSQSGESTANSESGSREPRPSAKPPTESRSKESTSTYETSALTTRPMVTESSSSETLSGTSHPFSNLGPDSTKQENTKSITDPNTGITTCLAQVSCKEKCPGTGDGSSGGIVILINV